MISQLHQAGGRGLIVHVSLATHGIVMCTVMVSMRDVLLMMCTHDVLMREEVCEEVCVPAAWPGVRGALFWGRVH